MSGVVAGASEGPSSGVAGGVNRPARRFPDGAITDVENCLICHQEDAPDEAVVCRDEQWACEVTPGFEVPGWFVLRLRRHALGWHGMTPDELAGFGPRTRLLVDAIGGVFNAPATYVLNFGEAYPHFHVLIAARVDTIPPERRLASIMSLRETHLDRPQALSYVSSVREAYRAARLNLAP